MNTNPPKKALPLVSKAPGLTKGEAKGKSKGGEKGAVEGEAKGKSKGEEKGEAKANNTPQPSQQFVLAKNVADHRVGISDSPITPIVRTAYPASVQLTSKLPAHVRCLPAPRPPEATGWDSDNNYIIPSIQVQPARLLQPKAQVRRPQAPEPQGLEDQGNSDIPTSESGSSSQTIPTSNTSDTI